MTSATKFLRVILCDDDEDDRFIFTTVLKEFSPGMEVKSVDGADDLLQELKELSHPDLIFLDLNMPRKTGKECLKEIKSHQELTDLPVIIYSTSAGAPDVDETYQCGASLFVQKTTSIEQLQAVFSRIFEMDMRQLLRPSRENYVIS